MIKKFNKFVFPISGNFNGDVDKLPKTIKISANTVSVYAENLTAAIAKVRALCDDLLLGCVDDGMTMRTLRERKTQMRKARRNRVKRVEVDVDLTSYAKAVKSQHCTDYLFRSNRILNRGKAGLRFD